MNRRWTDEMDAELRRLYPTTTSPGLARHFGVTTGAVRQRLRRIGLRRKEQPGKIHLTLEQTLWLRRNYPDMATAICALYLGVSESSVKKDSLRYGAAKDGAVYARGTGARRSACKGEPPAPRHVPRQRLVFA